MRAAPTEELRATTEWTEGDLLVAERDGARAGYAVVRRVAQEPDEWELLYLETDAACRRQGVAEKLLRWVLRERPGTWFLEVRASNAAAIALYRKLGFEEAGRRKDYYPSWSGPGREEGIVFRLRTC